MAGAGRIRASLAQPGCYAVFTQPKPLTGDRSLSQLSFSPRVFSPTGGGHESRLSIHFSLGRNASVGVNVYNLAGRLVRRVLDGQSMAGGANVVSWDGRDAEGAVVNAGMYVVSVEALGTTASKTVAVTR